MSASKNEAATLKAVPFFAYFLEVQSAEDPSEPPYDDEPLPPPPLWTFKFPSDWEDR
ncbi:microviridin/marinostatin family tricyclic proteinase inhibitor [Nostoc sp. FACHB-190]|uniref:microviridin/marinostatin family tricyclic proteinase inhibitor n=1 Tax=Nostoc sp. FACHB-190 TaxID=2692838 RepID=UPI001686D50C|nr:microviridin/marinostatin family tricyclic proteinase inhibitor [Nostoc sp. FACHB-190]MBD2299202.1 microviridin/marinostatin family tricyclic proteinase inhibitor [Nostoc sp. FACHB-190]